MNDTNDILALLRSGKSLQEIGDEYAKAMNAAKAQYDQEVAERKAAEAAKAKDARRKSELVDVLDLLLDWVNDWFAPVPYDADVEGMADEILATLDAAKAVTDLLGSLDNSDTMKNLERLYKDKLTKEPDQKREVKAACRPNDDSLQSLVNLFLGQ